MGTPKDAKFNVAIETLLNIAFQENDYLEVVELQLFLYSFASFAFFPLRPDSHRDCVKNRIMTIQFTLTKMRRKLFLREII